ncbi:MAG: UbiX family flavin prenyltransferase [Planctomycetota bacterium]
MVVGSPNPNSDAKPTASRIVVGITGASGAMYATRTIQLLVAAGVETHVVASALGQRLLRDELGMESLDPARLAGLPEDADAPDHLILHHAKDVGATIASGSFRHDGMVIVPCSSNTLGAIATGQASHLIHRAAHVTLKERRKLILVHRETPLSRIDLQNQLTAHDAGAIVLPANPGFYMLPQRVEDLVDFVVGRVLDHLDVPHDLKLRWPGDMRAVRAGAD